jgi:ABC-2 type transport system ATP-binding protein
MKDVAALCKRVVIIAGGQIMHDGSLAQVIDRFSDYKILTLDFAGEEMPTDLARFGKLIEVASPRARIEVDRAQIAGVLSTVLANYAIQDVSVEDPPLEDVIASLFSLSEKQAGQGQAGVDAAAVVATASR